MSENMPWSNASLIPAWQWSVALAIAVLYMLCSDSPQSVSQWTEERHLFQCPGNHNSFSDKCSRESWYIQKLSPSDIWEL